MLIFNFDFSCIKSKLEDTNHPVAFPELPSHMVISSLFGQGRHPLVCPGENDVALQVSQVKFSEENPNPGKLIQNNMH